MKFKKLYVAFTLLLSVLFISSCSNDDDDYNPISLSYVDGNTPFDRGTLNLSPFGGNASFFIQGGDGHYKIINENKLVVASDYDGDIITLSSVSVGSSKIIITDNSRNTLTLWAYVEYTTSQLTVADYRIQVVGENITVGDKKKLEEEVLNDFLVKIGGRYEFTFKTIDNNEGDILVYSLKNGNVEKGTFKRIEKYREDSRYYDITIQIGEKKIEYELSVFNSYEYQTRDVLYFQPWKFVEDVTDVYKEKYPAVEKVYAIQVLYSQN